MQKQNKLIWANLIGTMLELYDISIYGFFATYIATNFFPHESHTTGLITTFGIFFVTFIVRPLGSILWGYLGDTVGRRSTLIITILMMSVATCGIGLLPTANQIGILAPILLIICRIFQGLSFSGEFIGSLLFLFEQAPSRQKSFFASWSICGGNAGLLLASFVCWLVSHYCSEAQITTWGWRIPFLIAALGGIVCLGLRTLSFEEALFPSTEKTGLLHTQKTQARNDRYLPSLRAALSATRQSRNIKIRSNSNSIPLLEALINHKTSMLKLLVLSCFYMVICYLIYVWAPTAISYISHIKTSYALGINSLALVLQLICIPFMANFADKYGKKLFLFTGIIGLSIFIYPYYLAISSGNLMAIAIAQLLIAFIATFYTSIMPVYLAELLPENIRFSGVAFGYNIAAALTGGSTMWIAMQLLQFTHGLGWLSLYVIFWAAVTLFALMLRSLPNVKFAI